MKEVVTRASNDPDIPIVEEIKDQSLCNFGYLVYQKRHMLSKTS